MDAIKQLAEQYWLPIHPRIRKALVFVIVALVMLCVSLGSLASKPNLVESAQAATEPAVQSLGEIYVHIIGAVVRPGVYRLKPGQRVMDAVTAAGGFTRKADQASINLARVVTDGEQLAISKLGQTQNSFSTDQPAKINLNRASASELETLPGIGPTLAARLIDWRLANGGFKQVADLRKVSGIGPKLYEKLKSAVTL